MLLNFQSRFAEAIRKGTKTTSIRGRAASVGEMLHCYTGLRRPGATLLGRFPCTGCHVIEIHAAGVWLPRDLPNVPQDVAEADGFKTFDEMRDWFRAIHGLPYRGFRISWDSSKNFKDWSAKYLAWMANHTIQLRAILQDA